MIRIAGATRASQVFFVRVLVDILIDVVLTAYPDAAFRNQAVANDRNVAHRPYLASQGHGHMDAIGLATVLVDIVPDGLAHITCQSSFPGLELPHPADLHLASSNPASTAFLTVMRRPSALACAS